MIAYDAPKRRKLSVHVISQTPDQVSSGVTVDTTKIPDGLLPTPTMPQVRPVYCVFVCPRGFVICRE